jgi:hypothetical protein
MTERPILFQAAMVRAILSGNKTQTRRIAKLKCPYGQPGDRLWVREAWRTLDVHDHIPPREMNAAYRLWFEAETPHQPGFGKLRPSMFMPRWASRITLEITDVRVERLQDISEADCQAEGIEHYALNGRRPIDGPGSLHLPAAYYRYLWESINGAGSWEANPWLWVVEFARMTATPTAGRTE